MNHKDSCHYSTRLITKLKLLDTKNALDFELINKAICWVKKYHDGQYRKSGEPFYTHPLEVAYMISDYKLKTDVIVASILHDIVEDTEVTTGMILDEFGWRVAQMVDRLTRDRPDGSKLSVETILLNAYEKKDRETILIKIIDRIHNMETIKYQRTEKQIKTCHETLKNFLFLSESMGFSTISNKIFNICNSLNMQLNVIKQSHQIDQHYSLPAPALLISQSSIY